MCQSEAKGNCELAVRGRIGDVTPVPDMFDGTVSLMEDLNPDVVRLEIALDKPIEFVAGQFALLEVAGVTGWRGLSMATHGAPEAKIIFTAKRMPNGALSNWLESDHVGDEVRLFGPLGKAALYPEDDNDLLLIAGGSGLAPMLSILAAADASGLLRRKSVSLYFGVRTVTDTYSMTEIQALAAAYPEKLTATVVLSEESPPNEAPADWPGIRFLEGWVHEVAVADYRARFEAVADRSPFESVLAFLAGPPVMVEAGTRLLMQDARVPPQRIRFDKFS